MSNDQSLTELKSGKVVDEQMIIDAKNKIKSILNEHLGAAAYEVVDYLLETFFDGDKDNLTATRLNANEPFQKLIEAIQGETGKSKSWVYESIKLWLDRELLKNFEPYMQLSISHRALLLKVPEIEEKKKYAQEFFDKQLTYKTAKQEVRKEPPMTDYSALSRLINHPTDFDEEEFKEKSGKIAVRNLYANLKEKQQYEIIKKANDRVDKLEKQLAEQRELLAKAKSVQVVLNKISEDVSKDDKK